MDIVVYAFSALFIFLALGLVLTYWRRRETGFLFMATAYGASAGAAIALAEGWPLLAGFAVAWAVRLMGFDPDASRK